MACLSKSRASVNSQLTVSADWSFRHSAQQSNRFDGRKRLISSTLDSSATRWELVRENAFSGVVGDSNTPLLLSSATLPTVFDSLAALASGYRTVRSVTTSLAAGNLP